MDWKEAIEDIRPDWTNFIGAIEQPRARAICEALGVQDVPEDRFFSYQGPEDFQAHFGPGYYLYEDRPGKALDAEELSLYLCEALQIQAPGTKLRRNKLLALKANIRAIEHHMVLLTG